MELSAGGDRAWAQVTAMRPRLREHVRVHAHRYRGQPWYVLEDRAGNRYHRFDAQAWALVKRLDGKRSVAEVRDELRADAPDGPYDEPAVIGLLARLHACDLLATGTPASVEALFKRQLKAAASSSWRRSLVNPLAVRVPLWDPERLLARLAPLARVLFSPGALLLWVLVVVSAGLLAAREWGAVVDHLETRGLDPRNLALMWLLYPLMKALHELGHGLAVKRWGGAVHETGLMLLVFTPVPYVDASASTAFADKRARMAVGAAGVMVEVLLAALGLLAWRVLDPGLARDLAFNMALIGTASTVLFNGNPLVRFDGYFVLCDALECPNLASRSSRYLCYLAERYLFGLGDAQSPITTRGERRWFVGYGVAAIVYRALILLTIALFLAEKLFALGVLLALWVLALQFVLPAMRLMRFLLTSPRLSGRRTRAISVSAGALALTVGLVTVPVGSVTRAEGVVRLPEAAQARAAADGEVVRVLVAQGEPVRAGEPLIELADPVAGLELARARWRLAELDRLHARASLADPAEAKVIAARRDGARAELAEAESRVDRLLVRAPAAGAVTLLDRADLVGRQVRQGQVLAHVNGLAPAHARVVVDQRDAAAVRSRSQAVWVKLASWPEETLRAQLLREIPAASEQLPSQALGSLGGGRIAVDASDRSGTRALAPLFGFDLELPGAALRYYPGARVHVRFEHPPEALSAQWYRRVRQLLLARLQV